MITPHNILAMVKRMMRKNNGYVERCITHPVREWWIGLFVSVILLCSSGVYAVYLFWSTNARTTDTTEVAVETATYDQKLINQVLTQYHERQVRYEALSAEIVPAPTIPSINASSTATSSSKTVPVVKDAPIEVQ